MTLKKRLSGLWTPSSGPGAADQSPGLWAWRRALSQRMLRQVGVVCVGDSITAGVASAFFSWPQRLQHILCDDMHADSYTGTSFTRPLDGQWSLTGGVTASATAQDIGLNAVELTSSKSMQKYFASCTGFRVYYSMGGLVGGFNMLVDNATADGTKNINLTPASTGWLRTDGFVDMGPYPRGLHDIKITGLSSTPAFIGGVLAMDSDTLSGVQVYNAGSIGATSASFASAGGGPMFSHWSRVSQLKPGLVILALGAYDYSTNVNPATFEANLRSCIQMARLFIPRRACSFLILGVHKRFDVSSPTYAWSEYLEKMRLVAATEDDAEFLDASTHFPATLADDYDNLIDESNVTLTFEGHSLLADVVASHLLRPLQPRSAVVSTPPDMTGVADPATLSGLVAAWRVSDLSAIGVGSEIESWAPYAGSESAPLVGEAGSRPAINIVEPPGRHRFVQTNVANVTVGNYLRTASWSSDKNVPLTFAIVGRIAKFNGVFFSGLLSTKHLTLSYTSPDGIVKFTAGTAETGLWTGGIKRWGAMVIRVEATQTTLFSDVLTTGQQISLTPSAAAGLRGITLGGKYGSPVEVGSIDVLELAVWNRALTDTECMNSVKWWARKYAFDGYNRTSAPPV